MKSDTSLLENKGFYGPLRIHPGNITLSRVLGCKFAKGSNSKIITALPDIEHITISKADEFILMACDGIFDHLSKEDIATIIRCSLVETQISKYCGVAVNNVIKAATLSRSKESLTCILIMFKSITPQTQENISKMQNSNVLNVFRFKPTSSKQLRAPAIRYNPPIKKRVDNANEPSPYSIS